MKFLRFNHHLSARDPRPPKLVTERSKRVNTRAVSVLHRRERNPASSTRDMFSMSSTLTLSENLLNQGLSPRPRPRSSPCVPPALYKPLGYHHNSSQEQKTAEMVLIIQESILFISNVFNVSVLTSSSEFQSVLFIQIVRTGNKR